GRDSREDDHVPRCSPASDEMWGLFRDALMRLDVRVSAAFDSAQARARARGAATTVEHMIVAFLEDEVSDFAAAAGALGVDVTRVRARMTAYVANLPRSEPSILDAWLISWLERGWCAARDRGLARLDGRRLLFELVDKREDLLGEQHQGL